MPWAPCLGRHTWRKKVGRLSDSSRQPQPFNDLTRHEVSLQDFLQVLAIDIAIPDRLRIDDDHRTLAATRQTTRAIDPDASFTGDTQFLGPPFEIMTQILGAILGATLAAVLATIGTHKDVITVVGHGGPGLPG